MSTAAEFRKYAIESMEAALEAQTEIERAQFPDLTETWLRAATAQEGKPPVLPVGAFVETVADLVTS
jgi:hypothetical protein